MADIPGAALRDYVARFLRLRYANVQIEVRLTSTTADVLFVEDTNHLFPQKIAIEVKDWQKPLSSQDFAEIFALYYPALLQGEINNLWIISRKPLASSTTLTINKMIGVRHSTIDEFNTSLMNFSQLLLHNIHAFEHHEAADNFIPTRSTIDRKSMDAVTDEWLKSDSKGLMIFGGYGIGKTTYSLYMAKRFSEMHQADARLRIPVRIALGGFYTKQDLVGLICATLNGDEAGCCIPNFSYHLFLEMSKCGHLVLILDGFDEMRHAMDFEDFIYVFEQMQPLFEGNAKVILLGRPDSFLTNQEEDEAINALFRHNDNTSSKIQRAEVDFFTKEEIRLYIDGHIAKRSSALTSDQIENLNSIIESLPEKDDNILSRAVQLRMFTSIMDDVLRSSNRITRYEIYRKFIYRFLIREESKNARIGNNKDRDSLRSDRKRFMRSVAWWILTIKKENRFVAHEVPEDYLPKHLTSRNSKNSALREALVGSVIEPIGKAKVINNKGKRYYYFPHKSYIEFLVSEYFVEEKFHADLFRAFISIANNEILSFIKEQNSIVLRERALHGQDMKPPIAKLRDGLKYIVGVVDANLLDVCASDQSIELELDGEGSYGLPYQIYCQYLYIRDRDFDVDAYLIRRLGEARGVEPTACVLNCIMAEIEQRRSIKLTTGMFILCFSSVFVQRTRQIMKGESVSIFVEDKSSLLASVMSASITMTDSGILVALDDLDSIVRNAARGSFYANIVRERSRLRNIAIANADVVQAFISLAERQAQQREEDAKKKQQSDIDARARAKGVRVQKVEDEDYCALYKFIFKYRKSQAYRFPITVSARAAEKFIHGTM